MKVGGPTESKRGTTFPLINLTCIFNKKKLKGWYSTFFEKS